MFSFIFGQLCDKKNLCIRRDGNWKKKRVGCRWDGQRSLGRQCPFLFVCVRVYVGGGWAGWAKSGIRCCSTSKILVTLIFHDHLHYLMKINHLSLRNDDAPVGFSYGLYRQEINGHFIYCDTKGFYVAQYFFKLIAYSNYINTFKKNYQDIYINFRSNPSD